VFVFYGKIMENEPAVGMALEHVSPLERTTASTPFHCRLFSGPRPRLNEAACKRNKRGREMEGKYSKSCTYFSLEFILIRRKKHVFAPCNIAVGIVGKILWVILGVSTR
jgi:hypothetical protein